MKNILFAIIGFLALLTACDRLPSRYENIEAAKIRPMALICEPAEAAPGDSVLVRLQASFPGAIPPIRWTVALDYGFDRYGNEVVERDLMPLTEAGVDSMGPYVRFKVPDSVLLHSTQLRDLFLLGYQDSLQKILGIPNLTFAQADSLLRSDTGLVALLPAAMKSQVLLFVNNFASEIKIRGHFESAISLEVTKLLTVRYTRFYDTAAVNQNPKIQWVGIIAVNHKNLTDPDSIFKYPHNDLQYLFNSDNPLLVNDTVIVENNWSYFLAVDSGINGGDRTIQTYSVDPMMPPDTELYDYHWFYKNLDQDGAMNVDSLIVLPDGGDGPVQPVLPPVDTRMHRFTFYSVITDRRTLAPLSSAGEAFLAVTGYFKYTDAYSRAHQ